MQTIQTIQTIIIAVLALLAAGIEAEVIHKTIEKAHWYAPYEEPLLDAISAIKHGKSVPHEDTPADAFHDGEVLSSEDGRELGIVEETENGTSVLAKDLSIFPEGRVWYRTGIQIDDLTWSALWGVAESSEKTKKTKEKAEEKSSQYISP